MKPELEATSHEAVRSLVLALTLWSLSLVLALGSGNSFAQVSRPYVIGPGDVVRVTVFQNQDMLTEARVADTGDITFPLIGAVTIGGLSSVQAEQKIASALKSGGFVLKPQVNVTVAQFRSRQVSVLGYVNRPGRYSLEDLTLRLADVLSLAGGIGPQGGDNVLVSRIRGGKEERLSIDLDAAFVFNDLERNIEILPGDTIYVPRFPWFYVYGQVGRPGQFRLERGMTVQQAIALAGGITLRGTEKGIQVRRKDAGGRVDSQAAGLNDRVIQDDVIFVKESVF